MHVDSHYTYKLRTDYKLLGGCLAVALLLTIIAIPIMVKLKTRPTEKKPVKFTSEQAAVINVLHAAQDDVRKLQVEIETLRADLSAARASVPPGQEIIFWWENSMIHYNAADGKQAKHKFGLRADGVLVWKY